MTAPRFNPTRRRLLAALDLSVRNDLAAKGVRIVEADRKAFRDTLAKGGFCRDLRSRFGGDGWKLLQDGVGALS